MRVLVTGANGFIGSHVCEALVARGYEVRALVRKTSNLKWIEGLPLSLVYGSLEDEGSLQAAVDGVRMVFHTAAALRARSPEEFLRVNRDGTARLLQVAVNAGVKRLILFSSVAAAGPVRGGEFLGPVSDYGRAKLAAERVVLEHRERLHPVILRFPAVYGPRDRDGLILWRTLARGVMPVFGGRFSLIYVRDAVRAAVLAGERDVPSGSTYFISDGRSYSYHDLGRVWRELTGKRVVRVRVPRFFAFFLAGFNQWLKREGSIFNPDKVRELCQGSWVCEDPRVAAELGFQPEYELKRGAEETLNWYREQGWM